MGDRIICPIYPIHPICPTCPFCPILFAPKRDRNHLATPHKANRANGAMSFPIQVGKRGKWDK